MRIAIDISFLPSQHVRYRSFVIELFVVLANRFAEHQFIFLGNQKSKPLVTVSNNATEVIVPSRFASRLSMEWWYRVKMPLALRKYKADMFVASNGIVSSATSIPQLLFIDEFSFIYRQQPQDKQFNLSQKSIRRYAEKATAVATLLQFTGVEIIKAFDLPAEKVVTTGALINPLYQPLEWQKKEEIKEHFAAGCEYFIFSIEDSKGKMYLHVLKAFSIFKKWQKTNMKMVVTGGPLKSKELEEKLATYKYRSEVCILSDLSPDNQALVLAGAYALVAPSFSNGFSFQVAEAMQADVPVITYNTSSIREVAGDAALFTTGDDAEALAAQMKLIFKDEQLRNELISRGRNQTKKLAAKATIDLVWQTMLHTVSK